MILGFNRAGPIVILKSILASTLVLYGAFPAGADTTDLKTVQALYQQCKMPLGTRERSECLIYVSAIADIAVEIGDSGEKEKHAFACNIPSYGAATQAFMNWAERNPQSWGLPPALGVMIAITQSWPCK